MPGPWTSKQQVCLHAHSCSASNPCIVLHHSVALQAESQPHCGKRLAWRAGLLIVGIGKGTKASEHFMGQRKTYTGMMRLGEATPTYDGEAEPDEVKPWRHLTDDELQAAARAHFTGDIMQARSPALVWLRCDMHHACAKRALFGCTSSIWEAVASRSPAQCVTVHDWLHHCCCVDDRTASPGRQRA
jgi:TruB family pseudouridylate synthase (N terminal domain)